VISCAGDYCECFESVPDCPRVVVCGGCFPGMSFLSYCGSVEERGNGGGGRYAYLGPAQNMPPLPLAYFLPGG